MADINNLDIVNSFFHGSHQFAGIVISGGMQVNIVGNVMEGLGGPAIVVNDVMGVTIQANYFEGNDENAWQVSTPHLTLTASSQSSPHPHNHHLILTSPHPHPHNSHLILMILT